MDRLFISRRSLTLFLLLIMTALLSSCSHMKRKDGPPNFYVDETKIPNAVPKKEPLSKLGNMKSYKVFGQRYYTMKTSRNFVQVGTASWYGTQFHEHRTSSGEPYDMLAMTAAHKTLPLPTYLEVTNLRNKRKVIVKVNDRGPFASDRIIDLSYVAAKKLGMIGHGTTTVRIKAVNPGEDDDTPIKNRIKAIYFRAGFYQSLAGAKKMRARLAQSVRAPVKISRCKVGARSYSVIVGPIKDVVAAKKIDRQLQTLGIQTTKKYGV